MRWLVAGLVILVACGNGERVAAPAGARRTAIAVHVTPVRRGEIAEVLDVIGETAALTELRLASPVAGRVTFLAAQAGESLAAGEVAARVIPRETEAALQGFALLADMAPAVAAPRDKARLRAGDIPLASPFAAVVAGRLHNPGEEVAPGDVLLELFDPRSLYVVAQVPIDVADRVAVGMPVEVRGSGLALPGRVAAVLIAITPRALTVPVRVSLSAVPERPLLHAPVRCAITTARRRDALLIPRSALLSPSGTSRATVMVVRHGRAERRAARLGLITPDQVEVLRGLRAGDEVISEGQYGLPDGTPVTPARDPGA